MRRFVSVFTLVGVLVLSLANIALATVQTENCDFDENEQFKYEVDQNVWEPSDPGVNLIVISEKVDDNETEVTEFGAPEGWLVVCQKAPHENAGVSHVVIERVTTTTTQPEETTTTTIVEETTTTTERETTTTNVEESTSTTNVEEETTTTTNDETTSTENENTETPVGEKETLPYTGVNGYYFLIALGLSLAGLAALGYASRYVQE